jgi:exodeoxyribonuclease VII small subunit
MAKKSETYENMTERLQQIADKLLDGNLPLEEMIKLYEEGAKLASKCREMLEGYKARLDIIEKQNGEKDDE